MELLGHITVEPTLFLQHLGDALIYVIYQNLIIAKICASDFTGNSSINCDLNPKRSKIEKNGIQASSSNFLLFNSLMANSFPIIITLYIGVWSDRHSRRKPALILGLTGKVFRSLGILLNTHFFQWHPLILLFTATLPEALGGGTAVIHTAAYAYIADSSGLKSRTWRMGLAEGASLIGSPLGLYLGMFLFEFNGGGNYLLVFGVSLLIHLINLLYTCFWIREITNPKIEIAIKDETKNTKNLFVSYIFGAFKTILTPRPRHVRKFLLAVLAILFLFGIAQHGEASVRYLFTRTKFEWNEKQFTEWTITETISLSLGLVIVMPLLTRLLKFSDPLNGLIATLFRISSRVCFGLASQSNYFYYGSILDLPSIIATLSGKSLLSKIIPSDERGRAFAFLGFVDTIVPLVGVPLYSIIFTRTLTFDPSCIYYLSISLYALAFLLFWALFGALRMGILHFNGGSGLEEQEMEN